MSLGNYFESSLLSKSNPLEVLLVREIYVNHLKYSEPVTFLRIRRTAMNMGKIVNLRYVCESMCSWKTIVN